MLSRFKEERLFQERSKEDAVFNMLQNSGHVVLLSGSTLFTTFILLLIFPQNFLQSVGYTCSVVVLAAMIVNMSVTPAMLLQCECFSHFDPICFTKPHRSLCCLVPREMSPWGAAEKREADLRERALVPGNYLSRLSFLLFGGANAKDAGFFELSEAANAKLATSSAAVAVAAASLEEAGGAGGADGADGAESKQNAELLPAETEQTSSRGYSLVLGGAVSKEGGPFTQQPPAPARNLWFKIAYFVTKHASLVLLVLCGVTIPFLITFLNFTPTSDDYLIYLQTSRSLAGLKVMKANFAEGRLSPYAAILVTEKANAVLTQDYFSTETALVNYLLTDQKASIDPSGITCLSYFQSTPVSLATALQYLDATSGPGQTATGQAYRLFAGSLISADGSASMVQMELSIPPNSQISVPYIRSTRDELLALYKSPPVPALPVKMYLFGGYTTTLDVQDSLYVLVPVMVGITIAIVLFMVGISFGSVLIALRLAFTVFVSLCWTYGLMVLVYQPGKSQNDFAVLTPSIMASSGIYWIIPIMSFSILVGLALDYHCFLI